MALGRDFIRDEAASIPVMLSLSAIALIGSAGLALDYALWDGERVRLQTIADSAVLKAASLLKAGASNQEITLAVQGHIAAFLPELPGSQLKTFSVSADKREVTAHLTKVGVRSLTRVVFPYDPIIEVNATAALASGSGGAACVWALDRTMSRALEGTGGSSFTAPGCAVQVDSSISEAVNLSGGGTITAARNCFAGGVKSGLSGISPAPESSCQPKTDTLALLPKPNPAWCDHNGYSANTSRTLLPGVYCNGLRLSDQTFTLEPGLYIIKDGAFVSSGGATIIGNGVSFYLTGPNSALTWSGGGVYQIKAMSSGLMAGFIVYMNPDSTPASKSVISGGGATTYEGVFYLPKQKLEVSGTGAVASTSPFTVLVAKSILFSGTSVLQFSADQSRTSLPIPTGLMSAGNTIVLKR